MAKAEIYIGESYELAFSRMKEQRTLIEELAKFLKQTSEGVQVLTATNNLNNTVVEFLGVTIETLEGMLEPIDNVINQTDVMLQGRKEVAELSAGILQGIQ